MGDAWFTGCADELARCLVDARTCAETCEAYLGSLAAADAETVRRAVDLLAAPAAVARVLIELIDQPAPLVLAAARLCRDLTAAAAEQLAAPAELVAALRAAGASATELLEAAG